MTTTTKALVLKTDGTTQVIDLPRDGAGQVIHEIVGGYFDIARNYNPHINAEVTAYVHDEGLIIGLPVNVLASMIIGQYLVGDAVIVGKTDSEGYDTDVPNELLEVI
jgi:hypothetical protein